MDATELPPHGIVVTPRLLALLDERERQIAEDRKTNPGIPWRQALDEIFGPLDDTD
jgi:hypothetical protein